MCLFDGKPISPEMPGVCYKCCLYLSTCLPIIKEGILVGTECSDNENYCEWCPNYESCGKQKGLNYEERST